MNSLVEKNIISEMTCGSNFAYILSDNSTFLSTEYKVLQSQTSSSFVKCMKMLYNGKIQLYYLTSAYKPLTVLFPSLDVDRFLTVTANLLSDIIEVKSNGFLSCQNLDISFEHIFVDPSTYKVSLVYLPTNQRMFEDFSIFETELRTSLVKLISGLTALSSPKTIQLSSGLSNGALSLEDLCNRIKGGTPPVKPPHPVNPVPNSGGQSAGVMRIVSLNSPSRIEISVNKDEFVLGKKVGQVDGVISFNDKISRVHCKVNRNGNYYTLTDLHSANGTYINHVRLQPDVPHPIKNGDVIRLANSDFQIVM